MKKRTLCFLLGLYLPICVLLLIDLSYVVDLVYYTTNNLDMLNHADMLISYITYSDTYYYLQVANCGILFLITIIFSYHLGKPRKKKEDV